MCDYCKYDITSESFESCIVCQGPTIAGTALCKQHKLPYSRAWCIGERQEALRRLIDAYKFERARGVSQDLVDLLDAAVPILPGDVTIVSVPTIRKHVRQRGYDHMALVGEGFANKRGLRYEVAITHQTQTSQRGKTHQERRRQAEVAFHCPTDVTGTCVLIDDVFTTGASLEFAAKELRRAGADDVWVIVIARQPMEK